MTVKNKPKELDWAEFLKQMGWDKPYTFTLEKQRVKSLLTQQRTELENSFKEKLILKGLEDFKICREEIEKARTELLEEILGLECLKEEKEKGMYWSEEFEELDKLRIRNQLRTEIKKEIKKL